MSDHALSQCNFDNINMKMENKRNEPNKHPHALGYWGSLMLIMGSNMLNRQMVCATTYEVSGQGRCLVYAKHTTYIM